MNKRSEKDEMQDKLPSEFVITYLNIDERMFGNLTASIHGTDFTIRIDTDRSLIEGKIFWKSGFTMSIVPMLRSLGCKSSLKIGYTFDEFAQGLKENLETIRHMDHE